MDGEKTINDVWHLLGQMDSKLDRVVSDTAEHETRILKLEKTKMYERGFMAAVGGVFSLLAMWLFGAR